MENFYWRYISQYCERAGAGFFSEPFNVISSLAILVSAYFIYKFLKKQAIKSFRYWFLFLLLVIVGFGSILWHSFRHPLVLALDAIPIYIFFFTFLYLLLKRLTESTIGALVLLISFFVVQVLASYFFPDFINGTVRHVIFATFSLSLIIWVYRKFKNLNRHLLAAFLLYVLAIIFRLIDNSVCSIFPIGTHFLWHILNAAVAYFAIRALLKINSTNYNSL